MEVFNDDEPKYLPNLVFDDDLPNVSLMGKARDALNKAETLKFRDPTEARQLFTFASTGFLKVLQYVSDPLVNIICEYCAHANVLQTQQTLKYLSSVCQYNIDQLTRLTSSALPATEPVPIELPLDESWMGRAALKGSRNSLYESVKLSNHSGQMDPVSALQDLILLEAKLADIGLMPHSQIYANEIPSPSSNKSDIINAALGESFLYLSSNPMSKSFFPATVMSEAQPSAAGPYGGRKKTNAWSVMPWGRPPVAPRNTPQGMDSSVQDFMSISPVSNSSAKLGSQSRDTDTQAEGMFRLLKSMETLTAENNSLLAKIEELSEVQRENVMLKQQMDEFKAEFQNRIKRIKTYLKENKLIPTVAASNPSKSSRDHMLEEEEYKKRQAQMEKTIRAMLTRLEEAQAELEAKNHKIRQYEKMNKRITPQASSSANSNKSSKDPLKAPLSPPSSPRGRKIAGIAHDAKKPSAINTVHQPINTRRHASSPSTTTLQSSIKRDHFMQNSGSGRMDHLK